MERNLDFDSVIERKNTSSLKYDFAVRRGKPEGVLPLWVADMDFKTSSYIEDALIERTKHGIFGYSELPFESGYFKALSNWMRTRHGWEVDERWLIKTPGVVFALAMAVKAYTEAGDAVLLQQPVYYPFSEVIEDNGRRIVSSDLVKDDNGRYEIDFEDFENKIKENNIKLFLLCSPHNPVGRVWTLDELKRIGDICLRYGVTVISDEIHEDFVFRGKHIPFASISDELADISVICTAPSKTFNLASMLMSNIFIKNRTLRHKFKKQIDASGISQLSVLGLVACEAAYKDGGEWYEAMLSYVKENVQFAKEYVRDKLPGIKMTDSEGTYLIWLDFNDLGLSSPEIDKKIIHEAGLWLDSGSIFGKAGEGFQRINVACPRSVLTEALERIRLAFYS